MTTNYKFSVLRTDRNGLCFRTVRALFSVALILSVALSTLGVDVHFDIKSPKFGAYPYAERGISLQALTPFKGNLLGPFVTDTNGSVYVSNLFSGDYSGTITAKGRAFAIPFQITILTDDTGTLQADLITSQLGAQTFPTAGRSSWTIQSFSNQVWKAIHNSGLYASTNYVDSADTVVSNALYALIGSGGSGTFDYNYLSNAPPAVSNLVNLSSNNYVGTFTGDGSGTTNVTARGLVSAPRWDAPHPSSSAGTFMGVNSTTTNIVWTSAYGWTTGIGLFGYAGGLSNLVAANLTGALPAIDGSQLTGVVASAVTAEVTNQWNSDILGATNALNTALRAVLAQTNIPLASVTNAGTAGYSNANAFDLSGAALNATNKLDTDLRADLLPKTAGDATNLVLHGTSSRFGIGNDLPLYDVGSALGWLQLQADGKFQITKNGNSLTNVSGLSAGVTNQWNADILTATNKLNTDLRAALAQTNMTLYASNLVAGGALVLNSNIVATLVGVASTNIAAAIVASNSTPAVSGVQQYAALGLSGKGFRSGNSTSTNADFFLVDVPVQAVGSDASGSFQLWFRNGTNAPAATGFTVTSGGALVANSFTTSGDVIAGFNHALSVSSGGNLYFPVDGTASFVKSTGTDFIGIGFSATTASQMYLTTNYPFLLVVPTNNVGFELRKGTNVAAGVYADLTAGNIIGTTLISSGTGQNILGATLFTNTLTANGAAVTNLNADNIASGTIAMARLSANVTTNDGALTSGRVQVGDGGRGIANATASGAVPIDADGTATTAAQLVTVLGGTPTTNSATLTSGRVQVGDGGRGIANATASGAAPIDADGTATTISQLQTLGVVASNDARNLTFTSSSNWNSGALGVGGTNYAVKLRVGGAAETADAVNITGSLRSSGAYVSGSTITSGSDVITASSGGVYASGRSGFFFPSTTLITTISSDGVSGPTFLLGGGSSAALLWQTTNWPALRSIGTNNTGIEIRRGTNVAAGVYGDLTASAISTYNSNLLAAATITVGASPFNWTNTFGRNVYVFVDGVSVTGTVGINGTVIFNTIGQCTVPLQPNEWTTVTYTIGTPTATWKPF